MIHGCPRPLRSTLLLVTVFLTAGMTFYDMYLRDILPPHSEMGQNSIDATPVNEVTLNSLLGKPRPDDFLTPLGSHFTSVKGLFPSKPAPNNITMSERQTDRQIYRQTLSHSIYCASVASRGKISSVKYSP